MASFQAKIGLSMMKKRENKNCSFVPSLPDAKQKMPKKKAEKLKKLKNTIMASFVAKVVSKRPRKIAK